MYEYMYVGSFEFYNIICIFEYAIQSSAVTKHYITATNSVCVHLYYTSSTFANVA